MAYEKIYTPPYPNGWHDLPTRDTLVTAEILGNYDEAFEHIEDYLEDNPIGEGTASDTTYDNTESGLEADNVQEAIDELAQSGGGGTAATTTYDNTESGLQSTDVQGAIDELAAGAGGSTATTTTYDNTESGLEAENVQDAIDEVVDKFDVSGSGNEIATTIFDTSTSVVANTELTLDETVKDFTRIRIKGYMPFSGKKLFKDLDLIVDDLVFGDSTKCYWFFIDSNDLGYFYFNTDGDKIIWVSVAGSIVITDIQGINYSQTGWTKLLDVREESSQTASSYSLSDDITNYTTIALAGYFSHTLGNIMHVETLPIDMIEVNTSVHQLAIDNSHIVTVKFPTASSVQSVGETGGTYIYQVYGYK